MALIQLPLRNDVPSFTFQTDLDGTTFMFKFRYNSRTDRWAFDIQTANEDPIVSGIAVLTGTSLLERFSDSRLPIGELFVLNKEDETASPGRNDLQENVFILYEEAA
ncbi:MAG: hypothetical protein KAJ55_00690 [Anaerolineales bacterium]|nr:hypothetical protein [Anaerolineales bacterium]